jgi:hypothetical protein
VSRANTCHVSQSCFCIFGTKLNIITIYIITPPSFVIPIFRPVMNLLFRRVGVWTDGQGSILDCDERVFSSPELGLTQRARGTHFRGESGQGVPLTTRLELVAEIMKHWSRNSTRGPRLEVDCSVGNVSKLRPSA